ncbi:hypothetical protein Fcan01_22199 [Folsomia candida]|uniref:DDE Tnp4 domain-containing protein n=1 Tax=Folsomia candida TaxID=158441 RepID=A0A226DDH7_FOLCA|nr:hypothetical protein Fcan01_22199 [Folsomia candida]
MPREQLILEHKSRLADSLCGDSAEPRAIVLMDATVIPIEKSSNYSAGRKSFSQQKMCRAIKMMVLCAADGYILQVIGPTFANQKNNDEGIFEAMTTEGNELYDPGFQPYFERNDCVVWDRGFRKVVTRAERMGFDVKMPALKPRNVRQLSVEEANRTRAITMIRWPVEGIFGRIKQVFKRCDGRLKNTQIPSFGNIFRICCALTNAYFPPIRRENDNELYIAQQVIQRTERSNIFFQYLQDNNMINRRVIWRPLNAAALETMPENGPLNIDIDEVLTDFPQLNMDDLRDITLGTYQLKLSPSYTAEHVEEDGKYMIFYNIQDRGILQVRLQSRHSNAKEYKLFIRYDPSEDHVESIKGWYYDCPSGARNVGYCAHIASVLWYLGLARHQGEIPVPARGVFHSVLDSANGPEQNSDSDINESDDDEIRADADTESESDST